MSDTMASTTAEPKQPSLFTRLAAVESELRTLNDMLARLKEDHEALRKDRDEWRWRAERLLGDREKGILGGWTWRLGETLGAVAASLRLLIQKHPPIIPQGLRRAMLRFAGSLGLRKAAFGGVSPRLKINESQNDGTVGLAGPPHGPHAIHDSGLDLDEALAPVTLHRPSR